MSRLVLVGAGHAHMTIMAKIKEIRDKGHNVTVIGPDDRHYYSGMGPGMLGGDYSPEEISFPVRAMCEERGAKFIVDKCIGTDPEKKMIRLKSGREIPYDVVSFNSGSAIVDHVVEKGSRDVYTVKPIENLRLGRARIFQLAKKDQVRIGVVGGGPAGVEIAGNARACCMQAGGKASVRLYHGKHLMKKAPQGVRRRAKKTLTRNGIQLVGDAYVNRVATGEVFLDDGRTFKEDVIFVAMGVRPHPLFEPSNIPAGPDGGMLVNEFLQSPRYPDIFGGGDCIWFQPQPLNKVGVYAVRQNPVLLKNVLARLSGTPLTPFDPGGPYLLIYNTGGRTGILHKHGLVFNGRLAFRIKDYIDRRFMNHFKPKRHKTS